MAYLVALARRFDIDLAPFPSVEGYGNDVWVGVERVEPLRREVTSLRSVVDASHETELGLPIELGEFEMPIRTFDRAELLTVLDGLAGFFLLATRERKAIAIVPD